MKKKQITTPKSFFIKERDSFYSQWTLSFFREFFQNSTDANAKNIDITLKDTKGRGAFGELGDSSKKITRVVFADDGVGMNQDILDNVYFSIGQSTKDNEASVGGYGRARLMTCFSQDRYSILTQDRFVMGEGPDYVNYSLDEAKIALSKAIGEVTEAWENNTNAEDDDKYRTTIDGLKADLELVAKAADEGGYKGCRVEVDLDQSHANYYNKPTVEGMGEKLKLYLSESQLTVDITVNGQAPEAYFFYEDGKIQARRGQAKRSLSVQRDNELIEFGTVHTSNGKRASHKGKLIVRVDGASMYSQHIEPETQVILELDKAMSREVLTSNRDGLKREYEKSLQAFIAEVNIDNTSALADRESKQNFRIEGEKGLISAFVPVIQETVQANVTFEEETIAFEIQEASKIQALSNLSDLRKRGLNQDILEELLHQTRWGDGIIAQMRWNYSFPLASDAEDFVQRLAEVRDTEKIVETFFERASDPLKEWVVRTLYARYQKQLAEVEKEHDNKLRDMNDVHVSIISTNEKTKAAIRRNDPRKWDVHTGKGRVPRALLSAWTAACSVAVETMMQLRPATSSFKWTTGWVYSVPDLADSGDKYRMVSIEAMCQTQNDEFRFLLNPINEDGTLRYSVTDAKDRQRLQALAMHEVAHVLVGNHNEAYAGILTDIMMEYDMPTANRRMKDAVRAVYAAYEVGKSRVQAMDSESGPRPAERLLALASSNDIESAQTAISENSDGTWSVDNDRLNEIEPKSHWDEEPKNTFTM